MTLWPRSIEDFVVADAQVRAYDAMIEEMDREALAEEYASEAGQAVYRKRKAKVELPFRHIKRNLGAGRFLLRGLAGVRA